MRTSLLLTGLLFAVGCGVTEAELTEVDGETMSGEGELGTSTRSYVVIRHDQRKCAAPRCGGFFVKDVNRANPREEYVSGLDFSASNVPAEQQHLVTGAPDFEVVAYGKLGRLENGFRKFVVTSAWRGMPGVKVDAADTFYRVESADVRCITAPCPSLRATKLQTTARTLHHDLEVGRAAMPGVDQNWLTSRITDRNALVAGQFRESAKELVLDVSQVFVALPDMTQSCPRPALAFCPSGKVNVWTRDHNRCQIPAGCGGGGACTAVVPACADGYTLVSWTGGPFACTQHACDPTFLFE
ncbi:MAG: DUF6748 domain-containing protein [Myxococcota bacterium]